MLSPLLNIQSLLFPSQPPRTILFAAVQLYSCLAFHSFDLSLALSINTTKTAQLAQTYSTGHCLGFLCERVSTCRLSIIYTFAQLNNSTQLLNTPSHSGNQVGCIFPKLRFTTTYLPQRFTTIQFKFTTPPTTSFNGHTRNCSSYKRNTCNHGCLFNLRAQPVPLGNGEHQRLLPHRQHRIPDSG